MHLTSLRWALRAAEHSSFRAAAASLKVEQAALSRRIRALEDEIGVSLFERRRDGVVLTNAGREFFAPVNSGLAEIDYAAQSAKVAGRAETGALTVSFYQSLAIAGTFRARSSFSDSGRDSRIGVIMIPSWR